MSERYKHWKKVFKDINQRSPTKSEIASLAPPVIQDELRASEEREREEKSKSRRSSSIKLSRSFDERDYLPELALKKRRTSAMSRSTSATSPVPTSSMPGTSVDTEEQTQYLRRSPRKHPSSSSSGPVSFPSPQKPTLLSRPIATSSRLFNLLGSEDSLPGTSSATDDNVGFKEMPEKETDESDSEDENSRPFADEGGVVRRRKNENYRRLNMKRRYLHGTSDSKNKFKKWRRERKKR
ncbi:unnamed protein product [Gongylonema pulchrum]|uniref:BZIP domain-containing protein n=1 Tax=Gongylonema pulchrum TaxID=637853 RepID=A0A183DQR5_9BILA|nr:unnamed protein product [Gongylonema pulchrum]